MITLNLISPYYTAEPLTLYWTEGKPPQVKDTIMLLTEDFPDLKHSLTNVVSGLADTNDFVIIKEVCKKFNSVMKMYVHMYTGTSLYKHTHPTRHLINHVIQEVYNQAIIEPETLNQHYKPFSSEVYGETTRDFVYQMIDEIGLDENDTFIDLGSGVGQVVLQVAAAARCKMSYGIEKESVPYNYSETMGNEFERWMKWYGRRIGSYEIVAGDFLNDEHRAKISSATFIFVNNFAFLPDLNHKLKEIFADLKDGTKILSSQRFCSLDHKITQRTLSDIGSIMHITEVQPKEASVSWTGKRVSYYLHIIDRAKMERYFQRLNKLNKSIIEDEDISVPIIKTEPDDDDSYSEYSLKEVRISSSIKAKKNGNKPKPRMKPEPLLNYNNSSMSETSSIMSDDGNSSDTSYKPNSRYTRSSRSNSSSADSIKFSSNEKKLSKSNSKGIKRKRSSPNKKEMNPPKRKCVPKSKARMTNNRSNVIKIIKKPAVEISKSLIENGVEKITIKSELKEEIDDSKPELSDFDFNGNDSSNWYDVLVAGGLSTMKNIEDILPKETRQALDKLLLEIRKNFVNYLVAMKLKQLRRECFFNVDERTNNCGVLNLFNHLNGEVDVSDFQRIGNLLISNKNKDSTVNFKNNAISMKDFIKVIHDEIEKNLLKKIKIDDLENEINYLKQLQKQSQITNDKM